jgi:NAD(P)H-dependent flavin oxidoreductase YrpB (nitropropane dioxygenase family)
METPYSGGHQGISIKKLENPKQMKNYGLKTLLPKALEAVKHLEDEKKTKIPIIVAGGIYDGKDVAHAISLGASGVQLGSRFVCTEECGVADSFKEAYLKATNDDIAIIKSPVGLPARIVKNTFYQRLERGEKIKIQCNYHCLETCARFDSPFCIAEALLAAQKGDMKEGIVLCSTTTPRINKIMSVNNLMSQLETEAIRQLQEKK